MFLVVSEKRISILLRNLWTFQESAHQLQIENGNRNFHSHPHYFIRASPFCVCHDLCFHQTPPALTPTQRSKQPHTALKKPFNGRSIFTKYPTHSVLALVLAFSAMLRSGHPKICVMVDHCGDQSTALDVTTFFTFTEKSTNPLLSKLLRERKLVFLVDLCVVGLSRFAFPLPSPFTRQLSFLSLIYSPSVSDCIDNFCLQDQFTWSP